MTPDGWPTTQRLGRRDNLDVVPPCHQPAPEGGDTPARPAEPPVQSDRAEPRPTHEAAAHDAARGAQATLGSGDVTAPAPSRAISPISEEQLRLVVESGLMCLWDLDVATGLVHRWGD